MGKQLPPIRSKSRPSYQSKLYPADQKDVPSPFPRASLGAIGRTVEVKAKKDKAGNPTSLVSIPYSDDDLGWVDPQSLRLFLIDKKSGAFHLVDGSWVDTVGHVVYAVAHRSGLYTAIGLPKEPQVLAFVEEVASLSPLQGALEKQWHHPLCQKILCADVALTLPPPRGLGGDICDACYGLTIPPNMLAEAQLLPARPQVGPSFHTKPSPQTPSPLPVLYVLSIVKASNSNQPDEWRAVVEVVDIQTWRRVNVTDVGAALSENGGRRLMPNALAVSGTKTIALLYHYPSRVEIIEPNQKWSVPIANGWDFYFSPDSQTLWIAGSEAGVQALDIVTRTVRTVVPRSQIPPQWYPTSIAMSPDGTTVATTSRGVLVLNPTNGGAASWTVLAHNEGLVGFVDNEVLLLADGFLGRNFTLLRIPTGTQRRFPFPSGAAEIDTLRRFSFIGRSAFVRDRNGQLVEIDCDAAQAYLRLPFNSQYVDIRAIADARFPNQVICSERNTIRLFDRQSQTLGGTVYTCFTYMGPIGGVIDLAMGTI